MSNNDSETARAASLIEKLTNRPKTARRDFTEPGTPEPVVEVVKYQIPVIEESLLDEFIRRIREKRLEDKEFIYMLRGSVRDNCDYVAVSAAEAINQENNEYYTLSANGLSVFVNGSPVEFQKLGDWLTERRNYFDLKNVAFFQQFRVWKTVKMWQRNISRFRRDRRRKKLEDKLYMVDPAYAKVLLAHRYMCMDIERMKFIDIPGYLDQTSLEDFVKRQRDRIEEVKKYIHDSNKALRENVVQGVLSIMNQLREDIVMDIAAEKNYGKINLQMFPHARKICPLYEKMGFPENMSYGQRSVLRKECSRYIRFSYLADFIALESLHNLYLMSVRELILKIYEQISENENTNDSASDKSIIMQAESKKRVKLPLFKISLKLQTDSHNLPAKSPITHEFVPRKSPADEFHPNLHLSFDGENLSSSAVLIPGLENKWLKLSPIKESFISTIEGLISEGLSCLKLIERWSRHPDMNDFASALEEWDDKVATRWTIPSSLELDFMTWLEDYPLFKNIHRKLSSLMKRAFRDCSQHFSQFQYAIAALWKNAEIDYSLLEKENLLQKIDAFEWTFNMFKAQRVILEKTPKIIDSGLFRIDCSDVRNTIINSSRDSFKKVQSILLNLIRVSIKECKTWASKSAGKLGTKVFTVEEFVDQKLALVEVNEKISEVKRKLDLLGQLFNLGLRSEIGLVTDDTDIFQNTTALMSTLNGYIIGIESTNEKQTLVHKKKLKAMIPDFLQDVQVMNLKILDQKYLRLENDLAPVIEELKYSLKRCEEFEGASKKLTLFQEVLGEPLNSFEEVRVLQEHVEVRHKLWTGLQAYEKIYKALLYSPLKSLRPQEAIDEAEEYLRIVRRSESLLPESTVLDKLKSMVLEISGIMPVIIALRAPLLDTHWKLLRRILGAGFEVNEGYTLSSLSKYKMIENSEQIQAIGVQASQEFDLKTQLREIIATWEEMEIPLRQFSEKDVWILGDIEPIVTNLEECLARINIISGNRYVAPLRDQVVMWRNYLNGISDTLDEWTTLQKSWMHFQAIFASQDIKRRLTTETQIFESVDKFYRTLMKKVNLNNNALRLMVLEGKLLEHLKKHNNSLDIVQRNLSQYLEDKRMIFPRFYFISDEELLKVLAKAGTPLALQPFINKCFENIHHLEFSEDLKSGDILAMVSSNGENVSFGGRILKARGNIEEWLGNVQTIMIETLMRAMKYCKEDSEKAPFKPWVLSDYPSQILSTVSQINWSIETEMTLSSLHDSPTSLSDWIQSNALTLSSLIQLVRTPLGPLKRSLIVSMITTSVHNRDILFTLQSLEVESNSDFVWQQQLRYYWDNDLCLVKQINFSTVYAYEYLGCTSRLVVTPLTEKCWITITCALNIKLGASVSGPAGTGKTESTKDLAKALGQLCIVYNCSEQITYRMLSRFLSGLVQQGAWSCFDEFNRIDIEVLSVVAQQLQMIKLAQVTAAKDFLFEGRRISVKSGFGVFVTMNPGYAGRTELPDNLKILFRPVAMMIPDYAMISEIMLLAEGFQEGTRLSRKIVQLYKLASEQLSTQQHYDFGLRALKSVLLSAGEIRRKADSETKPEIERALDEDVILIQAMTESNLPKLVAADTSLFKALISDLFPDVSPPVIDSSEILASFHRIQSKSSLQCSDSLDKKTLELQSTLQVRFGTMLVGPALSGKSTVLNTLATFQNIHLHSINPKAVTIGELYGDMNVLTQDWKDGLASSILREITGTAAPASHWVVFDGPVDPLWIESMNTVLDDNIMLCLPNGERIKLKPEMRILFEVADLKTASPATVSRCGMVYVPAETLTWDMMAKAWLHKLENTEVRKALGELFAGVVPSVLRTYDESTDMVPVSDKQKVQKLCGLLEVLMEKGSFKVKHLPSLFAFAVIWSLGALLEGTKYERVSYK